MAWLPGSGSALKLMRIHDTDHPACGSFSPLADGKMTGNLKLGDFNKILITYEAFCVSTGT
jgi:hypothetical protein